ncbi:MAG TPA: GWxTD domain-containing protein [Gemmatimonadales bacterium]|nr:GWxTD domain-containing protein [Gemmatimonadales bacterium]
MRRQFFPLRAPWVLLALALPAAAPGQAAQALSGRDRIAAANEAVLDSLYAPLVYIMLQSERGIYPGLGLTAKRDFLRMFWVKRDPTPGTPRNEAEEQFNARIAYVNKKFSEGGATPAPGWRTDRGRIYLRYGPPDVTVTRRGVGKQLPFQLWGYTSGVQRRKYCFVDLTRFGNYSLVYSTDTSEPTRGDWRTLMGWDAYDDVLNF